MRRVPWGGGLVVHPHRLREDCQGPQSCCCRLVHVVVLCGGCSCELRLCCCAVFLNYLAKDVATYRQVGHVVVRQVVHIEVKHVVQVVPDVIM